MILNRLYSTFSRKYSTVYALSSGIGKCGVSVIRVTGNEASTCIKKMTKPDCLPKSRCATLRRIFHPVSGEQLDKALILWFPGPKSFTGEDSAEFHIHGGSAVIKSVLSAFSHLSNYYPAQPGDFTKRAFYHSKLDLTEVEGLGDLIHAETEAQRKQALRQMEGSLSHCYSKWRNSLLKCRAFLEAYIDFSEDDNIEEGVLSEVQDTLMLLRKEMQQHLADSRRGERTKSGLELVILGKPNVGKSTFLNNIVKKPAAIVSPIAGTTRDLVQLCIDIGGFPVNICDTAGLRVTDDLVEIEGVRRAVAKVIDADITIIIIEAEDFFAEITASKVTFNITNYLEKYLNSVDVLNGAKTDLDWLRNNNYILFINKADTLSMNQRNIIKERIENTDNLIVGSLLNDVGLDEVLSRLCQLCGSMCASGVAAEPPYLTTVRHRNHIEASLGHLMLIQNELISNDSISTIEEGNILLIAQQLQMAAKQLGYVTGHITTDDVLDFIFSSFCIGK